jgi:putative tricarboxylic transport membrane protein
VIASVLGLGVGFQHALQPLNLGMIALGLVIGILAGALPGITMLNSIVLVLPFTYLMGIVPALLLMIGVYCGGVFGGSITGILFNIPGDPMNVPTTWEGYQLSQRGRTQYALGLAIMSSAVGGLVSALFLAFFAPPFARFALTLSSVEFFSVVLFGLAGVSVLNQSSLPAALISLFAGLFLGTVGTEAQYGVERFAFGVPFLKTGVDFVTVLIGLFAIGEVLEQIVTAQPGVTAARGQARTVPRLPLRDLWPLRGPLARGTLVGIAVGGLAGAGATVSSFVSYGLEKQFSKTPELFGRGHAGALVASESSVNGSTGGAMIHLLTLGIPGSAATAVMMGAFLIHGIQPGPLLFTKQPEQVYTLFAGMILANVLMVAFGFLAAMFFATLMRVPAPEHPDRGLLLHRGLRAAQRHGRRLADDVIRGARLLHAPLRPAHPAAGDGGHPGPDGRAVLPHQHGRARQRPDRVRDAPGERGDPGPGGAAGAGPVAQAASPRRRLV